VLRFFDFASLEAFGADVGGQDRALGIDDTHFVDIGMKGALGTSGDLSSGTTLDTCHTPSGDMAAHHFVLSAGYANFRHKRLLI